jgi:hypothetical protein
MRPADADTTRNLPRSVGNYAFGYADSYVGSATAGDSRHSRNDRRVRVYTPGLHALCSTGCSVTYVTADEAFAAIASRRAKSARFELTG